jgi:hypothetical protein
MILAYLVVCTYLQRKYACVIHVNCIRSIVYLTLSGHVKRHVLPKCNTSSATMYIFSITYNTNIMVSSTLQRMIKLYKTYTWKSFLFNSQIFVPGILNMASYLHHTSTVFPPGFEWKFHDRQSNCPLWVSTQHFA